MKGDKQAAMAAPDVENLGRFGWTTRLGHEAREHLPAWAEKRCRRVSRLVVTVALTAALSPSLSRSVDISSVKAYALLLAARNSCEGSSIPRSSWDSELTAFQTTFHRGVALSRIHIPPGMTEYSPLDRSRSTSSLAPTMSFSAETQRYPSIQQDFALVNFNTTAGCGIVLTPLFDPVWFRPTQCLSTSGILGPAVTGAGDRFVSEVWCRIRQAGKQQYHSALALKVLDKHRERWLGTRKGQILETACHSGNGPAASVVSFRRELRRSLPVVLKVLTTNGGLRAIRSIHSPLGERPRDRQATTVTDGRPGLNINSKLTVGQGTRHELSPRSQLNMLQQVPFRLVQRSLKTQNQVAQDYTGGEMQGESSRWGCRPICIACGTKSEISKLREPARVTAPTISAVMAQFQSLRLGFFSLFPVQPNIEQDIPASLLGIWAIQQAPQSTRRSSGLAVHLKCRPWQVEMRPQPRGAAGCIIYQARESAGRYPSMTSRRPRLSNGSR
ncbi:hypothetical protein BV25DRAFT_1843337 [Artomyces pyxidatus]|uniref:Uncharacterized protein n=1 Tax=Artomyces pyxidatus TaxID=48021 RepID=A0ACB8SF67_9AGAM|nr:hypothetical protein BV25DRAFT_1843337 [Artomyces pyxidatus]